FCRHRGAQNCCFAIGREHRAIGLPGNLAGLEHETASAPVEFFTKDLKHPSSFLSKRTGGTAGGKSSARHTWRAAPYCRNRLRSEGIAVCTSGEPVSSDLTAYSPMSACLRSGVIDIDGPFND